ncbi:hypothetical protein [Dokdonella sp.]|uniref:hypothetical protein n=1 Tax=Dokdonella sp. TaxID=2291710 RepID=UPI002F42D847
MILAFPSRYAADETERRIPDVATARALVGTAAAPVEALLARRRAEWAVFSAAGNGTLLERTEDAVRLGHARLAFRHGTLGGDFHAYHNEGHVLEICGSRIDRLRDTLGLQALALRDWCALMLFGACHDLRQREAQHPVDGIGANERASIDETGRILDACGFSRERDADLYVALELMIAGSTFDARASAGGHPYNAADLVQSGGALASRLDQVLDRRHPGWRAERFVVAAQRLALVAADLDTANVAEPFARFASTAENLCREREMLSGRSLAAGESALPVLNFLTDGQDRFFFELHRFQSDAGMAAFGPGKEANAPKLKALCMGVRARIAVQGAPQTGDQVIEAYRATLADLTG